MVKARSLQKSTAANETHLDDSLVRPIPNPILVSRIYNVEFPADGHMEEYATNIVAENLYSRVDEDGFDTGIFDEIVDHHSNNQSIKASNGLIMVGNTLRPVITTKGW